MLFSEAASRKVVSTDTATTIGMINDFIVDPHLPGVVALALAKTPGQGNTLCWNNISAFGTDAVTVPTPEAVEDPDAHVAGLAGLAGK